MANNTVNLNINNFDLFVSTINYWDIHVSNVNDFPKQYSSIANNQSLITHFDFNNPSIFSTGSTSAQTIYSLATWSGATNSGVNTDNIGITGVDNGFITFNEMSGTTGSPALLSALTGSNLTIPSGDSRFFLTRVTGNTGNYVYPLEIVHQSGGTGDYLSLCGGFYQGFYKLYNLDYQVLPNRHPKGWTSEFWLRKTDNCSGTTATTLNDEYPDNKGFFFYIGTRAENKFWNIFEGNNSNGCTSGNTTGFCTTVKETDVFTQSDLGPIPLSPPPVEYTEIENQFLIYNRAAQGLFPSSCDDHSVGKGRLASQFTGDSITKASVRQKKVDNRNPFLVYHRAEKGLFPRSCDNNDNPNGHLASEFSGFTKPVMALDKEADVVNNSIGFRIKDDGSIGYRLLTKECIKTGDTYYSSTTIEESYTSSGTVKNDEWTHIAIKYITRNKFGECEIKYDQKREGKLLIYVNSKLKLIVDKFTEFIPSNLDENYTKQIGVPYNISVGGGTQGLIDSVTFDGPDPEDKNLEIEKNFAGTFIGDISQFRLYSNPIGWDRIIKNIEEEKDRYGFNFNINCA